MNQASPGSQTGADSSVPAPDAHADKTPGAPTNNSSARKWADPSKNQAVVGPFTVRDVMVFGSTFLLLIASLLPMFGANYNLWNLGSLFFLGLGIILPLIVTALFVARRLQPGTVIRIGSLSTDQFASVVASFTLGFFFLATAEAFRPTALLGLIGALGLLAATVLAPHVPYLSSDFKGRAEAPAHLVAREAVAPERKPSVPKPLKAESRKAESRKAESGPVPSSIPATFAADQESHAAPQASSYAPGSFEEAPYGQGSYVPPAGGDTVAAGQPEPQPAPTRVSTPAAAAPATQAAATPATQAAAVVAPAEPSKEEAVPPASASKAGAREAGYDSTPATMAAPRVEATSQPATQIGATVDPSSRPEEAENGNSYEAFWFAVPQHRTAVDERTGSPAFTIEPGGWVLALEDRGDEFLVQNTDGRLGVLRDLSNIERG
ncbi:hypothetical protein [Arthrobacter sp. ISL-30]|uniref:hypothetical protein n=1 Tax=Arthrobacter sp. ISL-30 TaxID=2819109 RepID=UPI001BEC55ED|nr:hypothetical protein [Arthrobacter sp. ISL-30]MBT2515078.1 hypothetical protein [Arthrobacter sp. ISL-30]